MGSSSFPPGFLWGASTASIQVEGGNGRSTFEAWSRRKGWTPPGQACRSWDRFDEDLGLLRRLNANAYRFSLEWSRLEPEPGRFDDQAFARYALWLERLSAAGIRPMACLHHWSEPAWLLERHPDGWLEEGACEAFLAFAAEAVRRLADRCSDWLVFNEPMNYAVAGYGAGHFPPGRRLLWNANGAFNRELVPRLARAHERAAALLKARNPASRIGVALNMADVKPATGSARDAAAAERWDWFMHRQFLERTASSLDFIGVNYYTSVYVKAAPLPYGLPMGTLPGYAEFERGLGPLFKLLGGRPQDEPRTSLGWTVAPDGLYRVLRSVHARFGKPLIVTENGMADTPGLSRESFLREHLRAVLKALGEGCDVRGYLHWSLLDNWEWGSYEPRFGLFTRERAEKDGAELFSRLAAGREPVAEAEA